MLLSQLFGLPTFQQMDGEAQMAQKLRQVVFPNLHWTKSAVPLVWRLAFLALPRVSFPSII
jgi:hypothetical protein